jgi:stearoyl-CoA desaturase (delta-9 desaturase)
MIMFGVTAGYHRYFSHRSFKTSRIFQAVLALLGTFGLQRGVIWWASIHRTHHKYSDTPEDPHSPVQRGFWYSHMGWIFDKKWEDARWDMVKDLEKYPELLWINKNWIPIYIAWAFLILITLGFHYVVWGCFVAVVLSWHATFCVNSLLHVWGKKVYPTKDESRNNPWLAVPTMGEAWHSNHHFYPSSARQGFEWWELDLSYYILRFLETLGLVWELKKPTSLVLEQKL